MFLPNPWGPSSVCLKPCSLHRQTEVWNTAGTIVEGLHRPPGAIQGYQYWCC